MKTAIGIDIQFDPGAVRHRLIGSFGTLDIGTPGAGGYAHLYFNDAAAIDAVITHLAELKTEMLAAVTPPVITDSERTCDQQHPVSGAWCYRDGEHDEHRDTDGETWTTAAPSLVGRLVVDAHDDSPCPVTGKVVGQVDEDTVEVLWGERKFAQDPGQGTYEPVDALRPAPQAAGQ